MIEEVSASDCQQLHPCACNAATLTANTVTIFAVYFMIIVCGTKLIEDEL